MLQRRMFLAENFVVSANIKVDRAVYRCLENWDKCVSFGSSARDGGKSEVLKGCL